MMRIDAKDTTDDYRSIDVRRWKREGLLTPIQSFSVRWTRCGDETASAVVRVESNRVILTYSYRSGVEGWKRKSIEINLDWTDCNLGGKRPWFLCPASGCGRRVAILYGGTFFACRQCFQLAYPSQREADYERSARRANRIREKLGWKHGFLYGGFDEKPKGMRWATFNRLEAQHDDLAHRSLAGMDEWAKRQPPGSP